MSRKIDIVEHKRQLKREDPIPPEFGFGVTIGIVRSYRPGRFRDLENAVADRNRKFWLGDEDATKPIHTERRRRDA